MCNQIQYDDSFCQSWTILFCQMYILNNTNNQLFNFFNLLSTNKEYRYNILTLFLNHLCKIVYKNNEWLLEFEPHDKEYLTSIAKIELLTNSIESMFAI